MRLALDGRTLGYDDRGRGPALVFLHAFPLDRRMWDPVARILERAVRVVAIDFRGLGESTGMGSIEDFADDAARAMDALGIDRAVVGGLSMGGYAALAFARRHAARMNGLLLADTRAIADSPDGRAARDAAIAKVASAGVRAFADEVVPRLVAPSNREALDLAIAIASLQSPLGVASALAALRDRPDATPGLSSIAAPTTVLVGTLDTLAPPSEARALAASIPGATLVEIPEAGHLSAIESPTKFADAVEALLARARG